MPERRPIAAEDGVLPVPGQRLAADARDVLPIRIGPWIVVDLPERGVGQRMAQRLAVALPGTFDAEDGARHGPRRQREPAGRGSGRRRGGNRRRSARRSSRRPAGPVAAAPWRGTPATRRTSAARDPVRRGRRRQGLVRARSWWFRGAFGGHERAFVRKNWRAETWGRQILCTTGLGMANARNAWRHDNRSSAMCRRNWLPEKYV